MVKSRLASDLPSKTAELAALGRAYHTLRSSRHVFRDDLAPSMCGPNWQIVMSSRILTWIVTNTLMKRVTPIIPLIYTRARFGEDCLETALTNGVTQYVIIGAGYDTFGFRRTDLRDSLAVYEIDHPATQNMKFQRMKAAGIDEPDNVRYIGCDLAAETVHEALKRTDYDPEKPAVFSWFGVTYYLTEDTVRRTLVGLAEGSAAGSSIVFDYLATSQSILPAYRGLRNTLTEFVAKRGEPMLSDFVPEDLPEILSELGYSEIENLEPNMVSERYPDDDLEFRYPPVFGMCSASVRG